MVMGKLGLAMVDGLEGWAAYALTKELELVKTAGWKKTER
jgi:hypothetical protein